MSTLLSVFGGSDVLHCVYISIVREQLYEHKQNGKIVDRRKCDKMDENKITTNGVTEENGSATKLQRKCGSF